jgi:hypothetical protein
MISLDTIVAARLALAKQMLHNNDPRLRAAFNELRREMLREQTTRDVIDASRVPAMTRLQAG